MHVVVHNDVVVYGLWYQRSCLLLSLHEVLDHGLSNVHDLIDKHTTRVVHDHDPNRFCFYFVDYFLTVFFV